MKRFRIREQRWEDRPFVTLVRHFARRMLSSDEEQGAANIGMGLGATLAVLAVPGAFASIFLMNKYSTLLQWFRGDIGRFNPYRASIADEYFFVVLSMTITGLIMVVRWNRLLPDRRDFANLAVLPIPIRNVFIANLMALLGLGVLVAVDINAVSAFLFPAFVTIADGSLRMFLHIAIAHGVTVLLASAFTFFAVFALVGTLMLLPHGLFRLSSVVLRLLLVITLLTEFASNIFLQLFAGRLPAHTSRYLEWLPSYWFLGIYERAAGMATPFMAVMGSRALDALWMVALAGLFAYTACYRRQFLRLAESMDRIAGVQRRLRIRIPAWLEKTVFRNVHEQACCAFAAKVLLRSERHLMFVGAYLGIGVVIAAHAAFSSIAHASEAHVIPDADLISVPLLLTFVLLTALRISFDMPAAFEANWIFRLAGAGAEQQPEPVLRKLLLLASVPWQFGLVLPLGLWRYGWGIGLEHAALLLLFTLLLIEILIAHVHKIPFTCTAEPDTKRSILRILATGTCLLFVIPTIARLEHWAMHDASHAPVLPVLYFLILYAVYRYRGAIADEDSELSFEERPPETLNLLRLA